MNQIDDYIRRLRFWLPGPEGRIAAQDVRSILEEVLATREEVLGRSLTANEVAAELAGFGRPEVIASRYSSMQPLVSAGLMPAYVRVLGLACAAIIVIQLLLLILAQEPDVGRSLSSAGGRAAQGLLLAFASITLTFAMLTRVYARSSGYAASSGN